MGREAIVGNEFDWFAVDGTGHVGHFATAGFGPAPSAILSRLDDLRDLDERVLRLPIIGEATANRPGEIDDWLEMARRGLFAFDWQHWSGPYRRVATPSVPLLVADLPAKLLESVRVVEWPEVQFAKTQSLRPEKLCTCE